MTLKTPRCVHVEKPEALFGQIMSDIRSWLDHKKIQPTEFRSGPTAPGIVAFEIGFNREDEAQLFEQTFAY
jgi:hypothetical protein